MNDPSLPPAKRCLLARNLAEELTKRGVKVSYWHCRDGTLARVYFEDASYLYYYSSEKPKYGGGKSNCAYAVPDRAGARPYHYFRQQ